MPVKVEMLVRDTQGQAKHAMAEAFNLIQRGCVALLGPGFSSAATEVSTLLDKMPSINRAVISATATSPTLSEPRFSNFLRTIPSDDTQAKLMAKLMKGLLISYTCFS